MNILIKIIILFCIALYINCFAQTNNDLSDSQIIEAQKIYSKVRCPTCVVQSIKDSSSIASTQIRSYISHQLALGIAEKEILKNLRNYYGDDILYEPVFNLQTSLLWMIPILFIVCTAYKLISSRGMLKVKKY